MHEIVGDLWDQICDARCITTNGYIKKNGAAVMGRGCALEAREKYQDIDLAFGTLLKSKGNKVQVLIPKTHEPALVAYPVKRLWWEPAVPDLIVRSAVELDMIASIEGWKKVVLVRPGCGNGQLNWSDVKPLIKDILDNRFYIIDRLV
mgnify:CR=1 FL=1